MFKIQSLSRNSCAASRGASETRKKMDQNEDFAENLTESKTSEIKLKSENEVIFFLCLFSYLNEYSQHRNVENVRKMLLNVFSIELCNLQQGFSINFDVPIFFFIHFNLGIKKGSILLQQQS